MWTVYEGWGAIASAPLEDATGYLLEFSDEPMLLVRCEEVSSIDSMPQSMSEFQEDLIQPLGYELDWELPL